MTFSQKVLNVFITVLLLSSLASSTATIPCISLWGNSADFSSGCSHWSLKPEVSIPALQELTVCFHLKLESQASPLWTAFMYRHPEVQYAELGLGGKSGSLVVWLFGVEWTTTQIDFLVSQWYSLCLTWTSANNSPALYIDGQAVDVTAESSASTSASRRKLAPDGTLSIGAGHFLTDGNIQAIPYTTVPGQISLFRIWGRERSEQEVTSLKCTEGDVVMWETGDWDTDVCAPLADSSLLCEWSTYKVKLLIAIIRHDGNATELYTARDFVHQWLRTVLPSGIYLHRVSVFEVTRSNTRDVESSSYESREGWWIPSSRRFNCLVHLTVVPSWDVAALQNEVHVDLMSPYYDPSGVLQVLACADSIQTTAVESFAASTMSPPDGSSVATSSTSETTTTATTAASAFTTRPANMSVLYFEVEVNVSMTTDTTGDTKHILVAWVNSSLPDNKMVLLGLQLLSQAQRHHLNLLPDSFSSDAVSRHNCVFQVQVMVSPSDTKEMEEQIRHMLLMPYSNGSVSIATQDIQISRILIINCSAEDDQNRKGLFRWPVTEGGRNATRPCPKNPHHYATRHCQLSHNTHWLFPDTTNCSLVVETIHDLDLVLVTSDNALDMVEMIDGLLSDHSTLDQLELLKVLQKLEDVISLSVVTPNLGQALINTISGIIASESDLMPFTNTILNITDSVGDRIVGFEGSSTLIAPAIAISVVDIVPGEFSSLTFGVSADHGGREPEVFINKYPPNQTVAFISLPSALQHSFPENSWNHSHPRVMFQFYGKPLLFKYNQTGSILDTFVVSASVINASSPIKDLDEDVKVTLYHMSTNKLYNDGKCVYWNFNKNNGQGGWDDYGCRKHISTSKFTTCLCDHLTHFGVLLDVTRTEVDPADEQNLTIITYIGCGVSSLFLGITILTYTAFEKLRRDYPSQILINLSLALLGLNLVFLVNSWLSSWGVHGLCVAIAAMLHYFLLASFTWMGLEAVNMYFALVKVFNVYVPSYILKFCVLGWGIPLVICILVLVVNRDAYGSHLYTDVLQPLDNSDNFCWLQDDVTFYVSVIAYGLLIFLFNIAVFVVVLIQIHHMRVNSPAGSHCDLMHELKGVTSLTLLLGLTWTTGFLTWGPARMVMLYLFSGLNSLQGLFIFIFHCLMKENVRKQWRIHLCFGQFRLDEYSEWSNSASVGVLAKPRSNPPRASVPSVYSVKSSSTDSTSASSDSSQRDSSSRRPNLGLFVNSLALPRAHRSTSDAGTLSSRRGMNQTPGWRSHLLGLQELK